MKGNRGNALIVKLLWGLHPEHLPEAHRVELVPSEPVVAKGLGHRCLPTSWGSPDVPTLQNGRVVSTSATKRCTKGLCTLLRQVIKRPRNLLS